MDPTDPKLIQALINDHIGKPREDNTSLIFGFRWVAAPKGFQCPRCKGALERTVGSMLASPWAGGVRCTACEYRRTVCGYLGESMFPVEPMPPGAVLFYGLDSGELPECAHIGEGCHCRCHTEPLLHDKECCSPCLRCGFRTVEP